MEPKVYSTALDIILLGINLRDRDWMALVLFFTVSLFKCGDTEASCSMARNLQEALVNAADYAGTETLEKYHKYISN